ADDPIVFLPVTLPLPILSCSVFVKLTDKSVSDAKTVPAQIAEPEIKVQPSGADIVSEIVPEILNANQAQPAHITASPAPELNTGTTQDNTKTQEKDVPSSAARVASAEQAKIPDIAPLKSDLAQTTQTGPVVNTAIDEPVFPATEKISNSA